MQFDARKVDGPANINKVKQYETVLHLSSVCIFLFFVGIKKTNK